jgi:tRNA-(ms[2]io[6]A)-hydroxylase
MVLSNACTADVLAPSYHFRMLNLDAPTPERWLDQVLPQLDVLLVDHAHCEKKAAGAAMNLLFAYVDHKPLVRAMSEIVQEELVHFRQVLDLIERRGIDFRKIPPSGYGGQLHALIRKDEPRRAVDRLLIAGLIEARSCERFALLRNALRDGEPELADFYGGLFEAEARHHAAYLKLASDFADEATVKLRLRELSAKEAAIIAAGDPRPRMHS